MKVALIPPTTHLAEFGRGPFHLLLSHLFQDERYVSHYAQERARGAYLVLDNSAHEFKKGEKAALLRSQAIAVAAQEVVVPDILFSSEGTVKSAISALENWYETKNKEMHDLNPALMYVPQGEDYAAWKQCANQLWEMHLYMAKKFHIRKDFTLGLSKDYESWEGGLLHILDDYILPLKRILFSDHTLRMHVHLLGWGRDLWKLYEIASKHKWIRSTDSAKPFVYAMHGIKLEPGHLSPYPGRPKDYFDRVLAQEEASIAEHNCRVFKAATEGGF